MLPEILFYKLMKKSNLAAISIRQQRLLKYETKIAAIPQRLRMAYMTDVLYD